MGAYTNTHSGLAQKFVMIRTVQKVYFPTDVSESPLQPTHPSGGIFSWKFTKVNIMKNIISVLLEYLANIFVWIFVWIFSQMSVCIYLSPERRPRVVNLEVWPSSHHSMEPSRPTLWSLWPFWQSSCNLPRQWHIVGLATRSQTPKA